MPRRTTPQTRAIRRTAVPGLVVAALLALSACVGIPTSGPVVTGAEIKAAGVDNGATFIPEGPVKGATQQQILQGFLSAFASSQNNYGIAREFLSSGFRDKWDPRKSVLVRTGGTHIDTAGTKAMTFTINTLADVDSAGTYTRSPDAEPQTLTFQFTQQGKQWRISEAPQGIVLLESTFESIFSRQTLYFLDPTGKRLVPDQRWFPSGAQAVRIASALLAGPPAALRGAVYSAFPEGTKLSSPLIPIQDRVAKVDLSAEALGAKSNERELMRQQLQASLGGVPSITSVAISVGDSPLLPTPGSTSDGLQPEPQVDARPLALQKDSFGYYENGKIADIALSARIVALKPTAVTLSSAADVAAVRAANGVFLVTAGADPLPLDTRPGLVAPSLDEDGFVWSAAAGSPNDIRIFDSTGKMHALAPALPTDATLVSLEVSRDGARVLMFLSTSAGPRLVVSAIVRSADQKQLPVSLVTESILDVTAESGTAVDATWVDGLAVATLSTVNGQSSVELYQLGGPHSTLGRPNAASQIVGGNGGTTGLRVLGTDGSIQTLRGSSWISSSVQVAFLATQR